jgi:hypothetical protein
MSTKRTGPRHPGSNYKNVVAEIAPFTLVRADGSTAPRAAIRPDPRVMDFAAYFETSFVQGVIDFSVSSATSCLTQAARTIVEHAASARNPAALARIAEVFVRCAEDITAAVQG